MAKLTPPSVTDDIRSELAKVGEISQVQLKWRVAERRYAYLTREAVLASPTQRISEFDIPNSFSSNFSRTVSCLISKNMILLDQTRDLPTSIDDIVQQHASHATNAVIRAARFDVLPFLLSAASEPPRLRGPRTRPVPDWERFNRFLTSAVMDISTVHTEESQGLINAFLGSVKQVYELLWAVDLQRVRAELPDEEIRFISSFKLLESWIHSGGRRGKPASGIVSRIDFLLELFSRSQLRADYRNLRDALAETQATLARLREKNEDMLEFKATINRWNVHSRTKSHFKLSGEAIWLLEERHPELCKQYGQYSEDDGDRNWDGTPEPQVNAREAWQRLSRFGRTTLSNKHPFRRTIDHHIFRRPKMLRLSSVRS